MKYRDRVKVGVSSSTPVSGNTPSTVTLGSAVAGYQTFAGAGASNGDVVTYVIEDGVSYEYGTGSYSSGVLTRTTVQGSSNSGAAITPSTNAVVYMALLAEDLNKFANVQVTKLALSATQSANNTWTAISWGSVVEDSLGTFNSSTPTIITAPSGFKRVRVMCHSVYVSDSQSNEQIFLALTKNDGGAFPGTSPNTLSCIQYYNGYEHPCTLTSEWINISAGDYYTLYVNPSFNGTLAFDPTVTFGAPTRVQFEWAN